MLRLAQTAQFMPGKRSLRGGSTRAAKPQTTFHGTSAVSSHSLAREVETDFSAAVRVWAWRALYRAGRVHGG